MKRIVLMVTGALVMALMLALAGPAFATIHEVARMECSNDEHASLVATEQLPPGPSPASADPELTGKSQGSPANNPTGTTIGQQVFAVTPEGEPLFPGAPPLLVGTNPSADEASGHALKAEGC
jgi:hypothetical protein